MGKPRSVLLVMVTTVALLATACAERASPGRSPTSSFDSLLPRDRLALPEFDLGKFQALLAELRGTPVVVNIWAAWCPPCRNEAPGLAKVSREFEGSVQFLGVDILDVREDAREFIKEFDWPYPHVFDPRGEIRDGLGYIGQPVTIIYDRNGRKVFEWDGEITAEMLRREVRKVA